MRHCLLKVEFNFIVHLAGKVGLGMKMAGCQWQRMDATNQGRMKDNGEYMDVDR